MSLAALLRTLPMALCLPLPGLLPRFALGLVLAVFGTEVATLDESWLQSAVTGIALGLVVLLPVWAARFAGVTVGWATRAKALDGVFSTLAWLAFISAGGPSLLLRASATRFPSGLTEEGTRFVALAASLALPTLLALALLEILAALAERFERAAQSPFGARRMTHAARPLVGSLLLLAGLAAFVHGVEQATLVSSHAVLPMLR